MNINARQKEIIKELDKSITIYQEYQNKPFKEINNSLLNLSKIIFSGDIEKSDLKYLLSYTKSFIAKLNIAYLNLFNPSSKTLNALVRENTINKELNEIKAKNSLISDYYNYHLKEEKAYISYWLKSLYTNKEELTALKNRIKYLKNQRKELEQESLTESTFYDIATSEEKDIYDKTKYHKQDLHKDKQGLNTYLKEQGYIADPKIQKSFIKYLRNYLFNLINNTPNPNDQNIFTLYDIAYKRTVEKFGTELITKPSLNRMLNYLVLTDKIRYDVNDGSITNCTKIKEKYNKELNKLFIRAFIEFITYIDIDKVEEIYGKCQEVVSKRTNFYPKKPLSLKRVMKDALETRNERKK